MAGYSECALIIGIDSFTGGYLEKEIKSKGIDVYGTVREAIDQVDGQLFQADLINRERLAWIIGQVKPDYIVNLAAISYVAHGDPIDFYCVNVLGVENILTACVESGAPLKKVILASSANVYGKNSGALITEEVVPEPLNHYGASKLSMEKIAANYFDKLPILITRPFNYTGVGQSEIFLIPKLIKHFCEGSKSIRLGNIDVARDFSSVDFLVKAYGMLMQSNVESEIFNICSGEQYSISQLIETLEQISGSRMEIKVDQALVRGDEIKAISGSRSKLDQFIGYIPSKSLEQVLQEMYEAGLG